MTKTPREHALVEIAQAPLDGPLGDWLSAGFREYSTQVLGYSGSETPVAFVAQRDGERLGVLVARIYWGALHVKNLLVAPEARGEGIAKLLMEQAFALGRARGCSFCIVETLSFQAPDFYKKLGFEVEFAREGFADGIASYYMRRAL